MSDPRAHLAAFDAAQHLAWSLLAAVRPTLQAGMRPRDAQQALAQAGRDAGVQAWFRPPVARFGAPARVPPWARPGDAPRLAPGMVVELEVAPATDAAFGTAGLAFAFETDAPSPVVEGARELATAVCSFASRWKCTGELFVFAEAWTVNRRAGLGGQMAVGFQALPPAEAWGGAWPQGAWARSLMRRHQVQYFNPRRMNGIYVIRPRYVVDGQGASFAEMILVTPDDKRTLGRPEGEPLP